MKINWQSLTTDQIQNIINKANEALESRMKQQEAIEQARAKIDAVLKESGVSLSELMPQLEVKSTRKPADAKYRNPANPAMTWTGRGRQPSWVKEALAAGASMESMAI